ncbi:hypothetical protein BHE74_00057982 [Ensete ventricosum]|nr:hypothetical protein BHE74_00057982 [Ensete ventricosum]
MCDEIESRRIVLRILTVFSQRKQQGKGVAGHGQTLCKGSRPRPHPLHGWLTMAIPLAVANPQGPACSNQPYSQQGWPTLGWAVVGRKGPPLPAQGWRRSQGQEG